MAEGRWKRSHTSDAWFLTGSTYRIERRSTALGVRMFVYRDKANPHFSSCSDDLGRAKRIAREDREEMRARGRA